MRKQCVPGLLFRGRPGNEARLNVVDNRRVPSGASLRVKWGKLTTDKSE